MLPNIEGIFNYRGEKHSGGGRAIDAEYKKGQDALNKLNDAQLIKNDVSLPNKPNAETVVENNVGANKATNYASTYIPNDVKVGIPEDDTNPDASYVSGKEGYKRTKDIEANKAEKLARLVERLNARKHFVPKVTGHSASGDTYVNNGDDRLADKIDTFDAEKLSRNNELENLSNKLERERQGSIRQHATDTNAKVDEFNKLTKANMRYVQNLANENAALAHNLGIDTMRGQQYMSMNMAWGGQQYGIQNQDIQFGIALGTLQQQQYNSLQHSDYSFGQNQYMAGLNTALQQVQQKFSQISIPIIQEAMLVAAKESKLDMNIIGNLAAKYSSVLMNNFSRLWSRLPWNGEYDTQEGDKLR